MTAIYEVARKRERAERLMPAGKSPVEAGKAVDVARQTAYTVKACLDECWKLACDENDDGKVGREAAMFAYLAFGSLNIH